MHQISCIYVAIKKKTETNNKAVITNLTMNYSWMLNNRRTNNRINVHSW